MNLTLSWIDWTIVGIFIVLVVGIGLWAKSLTKNVSDFLSANRCAGRYLILVAQGVSGMGAVGLIGLFEQ